MAFSLYRNPLLIAYGNFIFHYRDKLFPAALLLLLIAFPPSSGEMDERWDVILDAGAILFALAGESIRVLTVGLEYIKRGGLNKRIYADRLVSHGLFAHCRNPLYVGNIMLAVALLSIPDGLPLFVIGVALVLVTYIAIVAAEEKFLRAKFGAEFDGYCRRVNRWLPNLRGIGATVESMRFNWKRVLLKESSSFYAWIVLACLLDAAELRFSNLIGSPSFLMFFALFLIGSLGYATIRFLKQSHRLRLES
jgi:protein-S-isoprenylcysteine O-methyltransferase Ste14